MKKRIRVASIILAMSLMTGNLAGCGGMSKDVAAVSDGAVAESTTEAGMTNGEIMFVEDAMEAPAEMEKNTEEYDAVEENGFSQVSVSPLSTFSADVDTASYSNIRRMLNEGMLPEEIPQGAVRIEEMLNYFSYNYNLPENGEPFGITIDGAYCPWQPEHGLIRIGIKTEEIDFSEAPKSNLVFLLDVSGSMDEPNKLPLLKQAFGMLVDNLGEKDRISIVTYAGSDEVVLSGARGDEKGEIMEALNYLEAGGGTNGSAGIETAYAIAEKYFIEGGNNRVILATDGDLNIGQTSESELETIIEEKKKSGVYLSVLGFGEGNYKDNKLETLADCGNGNYAYIDSLMEAKRVLVDELGSTLVTVAEDVKFQVEFNPAWIAEYRLLGYENRMLNAEDFTDDTKDAGEIGAGHTVTVLYEVVWAGCSENSEIDLKYQNSEPAVGDIMEEWATLKIRYKEPGRTRSKEMEQAFGENIYKENVEKAGFLLEASVAEFGLLLRDSKWKGNASYEHLLSMWEGMMYGGSEEVVEFMKLVQLAAGEIVTCTGVPVYEDDKLSMEIVEGTVSASGAEIILRNNSNTSYSYGEYYTLEKEENGNWVAIKLKEDVAWHDIAFILEPNGESTMEVQWKWMYGELPKGTYRIQKEVYCDTDRKLDTTVCAEFQVDESQR